MASKIVPGNPISRRLSRYYHTLSRIFGDASLPRLGIHKNWYEIEGWFQWRLAQEEAVSSFPEGSRFVEVGNYLGRSLCSLADVVTSSGKNFSVIGVDTCRGNGPEGWRGKDYHGAAVAAGRGTFAGALHQNILDCGFGEVISVIIADSVTAASLFSDRSIEWVHLDARHDYASVKTDIEAWLPKVKAGGWLSGDDFNEAKWPGVVNAVRDVVPAAKVWTDAQWRWIVE